MNKTLYHIFIVQSLTMEAVIVNTNNGARALSMDICARSNYKIQMGTEHAEAHAVSRANPNRIRGSSLTVAGKKQKNGSWVLSKPCERKCLSMIQNLGISEVEFITPSGDWEFLKLKYVRVR